MNGILGMTQLLLTSPLDQDQKAKLAIILDSGKALLDIVNNVLDIVSIEAGHLEIRSEPFDLSAAVEQGLATVSSLATAKGLTLSTRLSDHLNQIYLGDQQRLKQILINLVSNAVKFSDQGEIMIDVECDDGVGLRFSVSDAGPGISGELQSTIFERFQQGDRSPKRPLSGTGLGLAIAKELVERMGGQIGLVSKIGKGSTFWFTVPLKKQATV
jgi:signal transduction histidine kinase